MNEKIILSFAASIIRFFIFYLFFLNAYADGVNKKYYHNEQGILSLMYHRFNENKYPSTNIQMDIFKKQIEIIKINDFKFYNPIKFEKEFNIAIPDEQAENIQTVGDAIAYIEGNVN